jgi:hypothetical protein
MRRRLLLSAALAASVLGISSSTRADDWGVSFGFGTRGGHVRVNYDRHHYRHGHGYGRHSYRVHDGLSLSHHVHVRVPFYEQVWVPPVYETVFCGYDRCGRPRYRQVCVRAGFYRSELSGYRCGSCGVTCY